MIKDVERDLLRNRRFLKLLAARNAVLLGDGIILVGLAFAILALPHGSGRQLGLILFTKTAAQIAMLLVGGVLADRASRAAIMVISDAVAGIALTAIAALVVTGNNPEPLLIALAAAHGASTGTFLPAATGILPELVPKEVVQPANAVLRLTQNIASIGGISLAGGLLALTGPGPSVAVGAALYLLSAVSLLGLPRRSPSVAQPGMIRELLEGWNTFRSLTWVWLIVAQFAVINAVFVGAIRVLGPVMAHQTPHGPSQWAIALAAQAAGLFVGALFVLRVRPRFPLRIAAYSVAGFAPPLLLLGIDSPIWAVGICLFITGICSDIFTVLWTTTLQIRIPPSQLSRISSYDALGSFGLIPLGSIIAAPIAGTDLQSPSLLVGAFMIAVLTVAVALVPSVRNLRMAGVGESDEGRTVA